MIWRFYHQIRRPRWLIKMKCTTAANVDDSNVLSKVRSVFTVASKPSHGTRAEIRKMSYFATGRPSTASDSSTPRQEVSNMTPDLQAINELSKQFMQAGEKLPCVR